MKEIKTLRAWLDREKGRKAQVDEDVENLSKQIKEEKRDLRRHEQGREIIRKVALETQQQLQYHISDITSLALEAIFQDPYELTVEFIQRRNKTECDLYFTRDGQQVDPISASGGGAVDVAAFALRIASWSMQRPKSRAVIVLDEPMRFLSTDHQEKASETLKQLSERLGIQFIIITHEPTLAEHADKVFETKISKGVTKIV